jgi:hypothetical protein
MKYLVLLYADESKLAAPGTPEMDKQEAAYGAVYEELSSAGAFKGGDPIKPSSSATTVRVRNGQTESTSGPFSPGGEQVIGFYILECPSDDQATQYAAKIPAASIGAVEVRPILSAEG